MDTPLRPKRLSSQALLAASAVTLSVLSVPGVA